MCVCLFVSHLSNEIPQAQIILKQQTMSKKKKKEKSYISRVQFLYSLRMCNDKPPRYYYVVIPLSLSLSLMLSGYSGLSCWMAHKERRRKSKDVAPSHITIPGLFSFSPYFSGPCLERRKIGSFLFIFLNRFSSSFFFLLFGMCPFLSSSLFSPCRVDQKTRERHIRR